MTMHYNFEEIDTHTSTLGGIVDKLQTHTQHIKSVQTDLLNSGFFGAGADGYDTVTKELTTKLLAYQDSLSSLKGAIGTASNDMFLTDTNNGKGFAGIG
ncbi:WXG100 family type VII secretion target [Nocardia sp. NPDC056100]|uniref:WXG100 family type VII secretion target n=1 Tax=Nocardia sp. NPDC056100 TaxID=3345712 RepID=UPI0035E04582